MNKQNILDILNRIPDPEIPVISIVELGIIRDVLFENDRLVIVITPTYSGCPAMTEISNDIIKKLTDEGFSNIEINTVLSPAWSTDWMNEKTKQKLKEYGIAPPEKSNSNDTLFNILSVGKPVVCPFCNSEDTVIKSQFGSTACKSLHHCNNCREAFEYFKCI